jgi:hypothetical protein
VVLGEVSMRVTLRNIGIVLAAVVVTCLYWGLGAGFLILCYVKFASTLSFFWLDLFRPAYYIPGLVVVVYRYGFRKNRGLFSESLAFLMALSMAMIFTLELIIYI